MTIYLDDKFRCHTTDDGTRTAVETNYFDGYCPAYIEGYVFIPLGMSFIGENGITHEGKAAWPWRDLALLDEFQAQYEAQLAEALEIENEIMKAALAELGVTEDD